MNALDILIKVLQVSLFIALEDWKPAGSAMMFELLERIQQRDLPPTSFLSKLVSVLHII